MKFIIKFTMQSSYVGVIARPEVLSGQHVLAYSPVYTSALVVIFKAVILWYLATNLVLGLDVSVVDNNLTFQICAIYLFLLPSFFTFANQRTTPGSYRSLWCCPETLRHLGS